MRKLVPTVIRVFLLTVISQLSCLWFTPVLFAQNDACTLACNARINISLDPETCSFVVLPDHLLEGELENPSDYTIFLVDEANTTLTGNSLTGAQAGQIVQFVIEKNDCTTGGCQGEILVEDKTGPQYSHDDWTETVFWCAEIDNILNEPDTKKKELLNAQDWNYYSNPYYTGVATFVENCTARTNCPISVETSDQLIVFDCNDPEWATYYARIDRRWLVTDCEGFRKDTIQEIFFKRPAITDFVIPADTSVQTCTPETFDRTSFSGYLPYVTAADGRRLYVGELECGWSFRKEDEELSVCRQAGSVKIQRTVYLYDWCTREETTLPVYEMKVGDFISPVMSGHKKRLNDGRTVFDTLTVSTGPMDCTAAIAYGPAQLEQQFGVSIDDCRLSSVNLRSIQSYQQQQSGGIPFGEWRWREQNYPDFSGVISGIPKGVHRIIVETYDGCNFPARDTLVFRVKDQVVPVLSCTDALNISLAPAEQTQTDGGFARVTVDDLDEGSWDNCGDFSLEIRRTVDLAGCTDVLLKAGFDKNGDGQLDETDGFQQEDGQWYTPWSEEAVFFFCCDLWVGQSIELRARDAAGNTNRCRTSVLVEDKKRPDCSDLPDVNVLCTDYRLSELAFGIPQITDNYCGTIELRGLEPIRSVDECGEGTIVRRFQAVKFVGTTHELRSDICSQTINVSLAHDYCIRFPADVRASCAEDPGIDSLEFQKNGCDLLAVSISDEIFTATADTACYKIFRTYEVINWCEYDDESQPVTVGRDWDAWNTYGTPFEGLNPQGDGVPGNTAIYVRVIHNLNQTLTYYDADCIPSNGYPDDPATVHEEEGHYWFVRPDSEQYARFGSRGYWQYTQHISVYDDTPPEVTINGAREICVSGGNQCSALAEFTVPVREICTAATEVQLTAAIDIDNDGDLDKTGVELLQGQYPVFKVSATLPIGTHRLQVYANDGCGNQQGREFVFEVVDCKAPAPICINGLTVSLMPTGSSEPDEAGARVVFADEFLTSPIEDCSGPITYSINRKEETVDSLMDGLRLNCMDVVQGAVLIEVHAWDKVGNHDFCETYVLVQDNQDLCEQDVSAAISGLITTEEALPVEGAELRLSGGSERTTKADANGGYQFEMLRPSYDYTITPKLDGDYRNGVSTYDLVLIQKHILGQQALDSPYKMIAADANNSGFITVQDMIHIRKLILNIDLELKDNSSWRFIPSSYTFPDPEWPWTEVFPEVINLNNLEEPYETADFVAIKIGDVNGNALTGSAEIRSANTRDSIALQLPERQLLAGQKDTLFLDVPMLPGLSGLQFSLRWNRNALEVRECIPLAAGKEAIGFFQDENLLTVSWLSDGSHTGRLLALVVEAGTETSSTQAFALSARPTEGEAISNGLQVHPLAMHFVPEQDVAQAETKISCFPNPFVSSCRLVFTQPQAGMVHLQLFAADGKGVYYHKQNLLAGQQEWVVHGTDLPGPGVYYYQLIFPYGKSSGKLVYQE